MDVGVGRRRGPAEGIEAAIGDVAVTVNTVHRDAKLDVIGIPFSLGNLRWRGGTCRRGAGRRRCNKTCRQDRGNQKRFREYAPFYPRPHNSTAPTAAPQADYSRPSLSCRVNNWKES